MTSVAQLPVEATAAKVSPQGETSRGRSKQGPEAGLAAMFAALLAQALPAAPETAVKAELAVALVSVDVEGEDLPAEEVEVAARSDAGGAARPEAAVTAAAPMAVVQVAPDPLPELAPEAVPEDHVEPESQPVAQRPVQKLSAIETATEGEVVAELPDAFAPAQNHEPTPEKVAEVPERNAPAGVWQHHTRRIAEETKERRPIEHGRLGRPIPALVEVRAAAPASSERTPLPESGRTEPEPQPQRAAKQQPQRPPAPEANGAAKRMPEMAAAAKAETSHTDEAPPVIRFQVRSARPEQDVLRPPLIGRHAEPERADTSQAARRLPIRQVTVEAARVALPVVQVEQAPTAVEPIAPVEKAVEPTEEERSTRTEASPSTLQRLASPKGAKVKPPRAREAFTDGEQLPDEPVRGGSTPVRQALTVEQTASTVATGPRAEVEQPLGTGTKATQVVPMTTQPVHMQQPAVPATTATPDMPVPLPLEEAPPAAPASPPGEPEIAARLHQQGGRTMLSVVLHDERLGRVALQLVDRGGWIETAIRASDPQTAQTLSSNAASLFEVLQQRGMSLTTSGGASAWDAQEGQRRDNPQREDSHRRRFRLRRANAEFEGALARAEV